MTQPTIVYFGRDGDPVPNQPRPIKIYIRTLLFSTSRIGQTIECMYASLERGESKQNFSFWAYGEGRLVRGSGLHVGYEGAVYNHHFLLPRDGTEFRFLPGDYILRILAKRVRDSRPKQLIELKLHITDAQATELVRDDMGIFFDWGPDQNTYYSRIEKALPKQPPAPISDMPPEVKQFFERANAVLPTFAQK